MKKLLMVGLLLSSVFTTGCFNSKERKFAEYLLDYIDGSGSVVVNVNSGACLVDPNIAEGMINKGICCERLIDTDIDGINKGRCQGPDRIYPGIGYEVVDHETEHGNVVLRKLRETTSSDGSTVWDYEYIGIDVSDTAELEAVLNGDYGYSYKSEFLSEYFAYNFYKFGYLQLDPNDHTYKYYNDDSGNWEKFSESSQMGKDLELMGSRIEDNNAESMGEELSAKFGLSTDRAQEVAKTMAAYNKLISKRALTSREENFFSNSLLGVDYQTAKNGLTSGDQEDFDALMETAARVNGISPEQVGAIVNEIFL